jgi:hypothetical protein
VPAKGPRRLVGTDERDARRTEGKVRFQRRGFFRREGTLDVFPQELDAVCTMLEEARHLRSIGFRIDAPQLAAIRVESR